MAGCGEDRGNRLEVRIHVTCVRCGKHTSDAFTTGTVNTMPQYSPRVVYSYIDTPRTEKMHHNIFKQAKQSKDAMVSSATMGGLCMGGCGVLSDHVMCTVGQLLANPCKHRR